MDQQLQRQRLIDQYKSYMSILSQKGLQETVIPEETLKDMDLSDLSRIVREVKELARTPN